MMRKFIAFAIVAAINLFAVLLPIQPQTAVFAAQSPHTKTSQVLPTSKSSACETCEVSTDAPLFTLRVVVRSQTDIAALAEHYDVLEARDGNAIFILGDESIAQSLRAAGYTIASSSPIQNSPFNTQNYFGGYRTVAEHEAHMDALAASHPDLAKVIDFGDSWRKLNNLPNGHDLKAMCITKRRDQDCALTPNTDKPRFFLMAAIHARELTTSEAAWRWMDYLIDNYGTDADVTWLLDTQEFWIVPTANPDGRAIVEQGGNAPYTQRKNVNTSLGNCANPPTNGSQFGIDLNRNHSFQWNLGGTSPDPCSLVYLGPTPASEPETQALESLMAQLFHDVRGQDLNAAAPITTSGAMLTLHSYSDLVLLPWGWVECNGATCTSDLRAPNDAGLRAMAFRMSYYNGYTTGQPSEVLYAASGTSDDWAYGKLGIPGFTFEMGPMFGTCSGFMPAYSCQDSFFWPLNRGAILYAAKVARQPYALSLGPTTLSATLSAVSVIAGAPVTLTAQVDDNAFGNDGIRRPAVQAISATEVYVDTPPWAGGTPISMAAVDGAFNSPTELANITVDTAALPVGRHTLYVRGRNAAGDWGPVSAVFLTVQGSNRYWFPFVGK